MEEAGTEVAVLSERTFLLGKAILDCRYIASIVVQAELAEPHLGMLKRHACRASGSDVWGSLQAELLRVDVCWDMHASIGSTHRDILQQGQQVQQQQWPGHHRCRSHHD